MSCSTAEVIAEVRQLISDEGKKLYKDDGKLIVHINQAITFLNKILIERESPLMLKEETFSDNMAIPNGYERACGDHPFSIVGGVIKLLTDSPLVVQYFAHKSRIKTINDVIEFPDYCLSALAHVAAMFALNNNEFDIKQDDSLLTKLI